MIELAPEFQSQEFFTGLMDFSHVWLLWGFHKNENAAVAGKVYPPRLGGEKVGVFATRSPHRLNPLGLTLVRILEVKENSLKVSGVDFVDGTPVYDIKPYLPEVDFAPNARAGWAERAKHELVPVRFSAATEATLAKLELPIPHAQFRQLIIESLRLDPRPAMAREREKTFYFRIYDWDIGFVWVEDGFAVTEIRGY